jgi:hypothetical protein
MGLSHETSISLPEEVLNDFAASQWLKNALRSALVRDPVDAANDADVLAAVLQRRVRRLL